MRHIKDVLRLRFHAGLSIRQIRASTGLATDIKIPSIKRCVSEATIFCTYPEQTLIRAIA